MNSPKESVKKSVTPEREENRCDLCGITYFNENDLREHVWSLMHHIKLENKKRNSVHNCSLCFESCNNLSEYSKHLNGGKHKKALESDRISSGRISTACISLKEQAASPNRKTSSEAKQHATSPLAWTNEKNPKQTHSTQNMWDNQGPNSINNCSNFNYRPVMPNRFQMFAPRFSPKDQRIQPLLGNCVQGWNQNATRFFRPSNPNWQYGNFGNNNWNPNSDNSRNYSGQFDEDDFSCIQTFDERQNWNNRCNTYNQLWGNINQSWYSHNQDYNLDEVSCRNPPHGGSRNVTSFNDPRYGRDYKNDNWANAQISELNVKQQGKQKNRSKSPKDLSRRSSKSPRSGSHSRSNSPTDVSQSRSNSSGDLMSVRTKTPKGYSGAISRSKNALSHNGSHTKKMKLSTSKSPHLKRTHSSLKQTFQTKTLANKKTELSSEHNRRNLSAPFNTNAQSQPTIPKFLSSSESGQVSVPNLWMGKERKRTATCTFGLLSDEEKKIDCQKSRQRTFSSQSQMVENVISCENRNSSLSAPDVFTFSGNKMSTIEAVETRKQSPLKNKMDVSMSDAGLAGRGSVLERAEALCRELKENREKAKEMKTVQNKNKENETIEKVEEKIEELEKLCRSKMKGCIPELNEDKPGDSNKELLLDDLGKHANIPSSVQKALTKHSTTDISSKSKVGSKLNKKTEPLSRDSLLKMINSPRSRKERLKLAQLVKTQTHFRSARRFNRDSLQLGVPDQLSTSSVLEIEQSELSVNELPQDIQLQIAKLLENEGIDKVDQGTSTELIDMPPVLSIKDIPGRQQYWLESGESAQEKIGHLNHKNNTGSSTSVGRTEDVNTRNTGLKKNYADSTESKRVGHDFGSDNFEYASCGKDCTESSANQKEMQHRNSLVLKDFVENDHSNQSVQQRDAKVGDQFGIVPILGTNPKEREPLNHGDIQHSTLQIKKEIEDTSIDIQNIKKEIAEMNNITHHLGIKSEPINPLVNKESNMAILPLVKSEPKDSILYGELVPSKEQAKSYLSGLGSAEPDLLEDAKQENSSTFSHTNKSTNVSQLNAYERNLKYIDSGTRTRPLSAPKESELSVNLKNHPQTLTPRFEAPAENLVKFFPEEKKLSATLDNLSNNSKSKIKEVGDGRQNKNEIECVEGRAKKKRSWSENESMNDGEPKNENKNVTKKQKLKEREEVLSVNELDTSQTLSTVSDILSTERDVSVPQTKLEKVLHISLSEEKIRVEIFNTEKKIEKQMEILEMTKMKLQQFRQLKQKLLTEETRLRNARLKILQGAVAERDQSLINTTISMTTVTPLPSNSQFQQSKLCNIADPSVTSTPTPPVDACENFDLSLVKEECNSPTIDSKLESLSEPDTSCMAKSVDVSVQFGTSLWESKSIDNTRSEKTEIEPPKNECQRSFLKADYVEVHEADTSDNSHLGMQYMGTFQGNKADEGLLKQLALNFANLKQTSYLFLESDDLLKECNQSFSEPEMFSAEEPGKLQRRTRSLSHSMSNTKNALLASSEVTVDSNYGTLSSSSSVSLGNFKRPITPSERIEKTPGKLLTESPTKSKKKSKRRKGTFEIGENFERDSAVLEKDEIDLYLKSASTNSMKTVSRPSSTSMTSTLQKKKVSEFYPDPDSPMKKKLRTKRERNKTKVLSVPHDTSSEVCSTESEGERTPKKLCKKKRKECASPAKSSKDIAIEISDNNDDKLLIEGQSPKLRNMPLVKEKLKIKPGTAAFFQKKMGKTSKADPDFHDDTWSDVGLNSFRSTKEQPKENIANSDIITTPIKWPVETNCILKCGHSPILDVFFEGQFLFSCPKDGHILRYRIQETEMVHPWKLPAYKYENHQSFPTLCVLVTSIRDELAVVIGDENKMLYVTSMKSVVHQEQLIAHPKCLHVSRKMLYVGLTTGVIKAYHTKSMECKNNFKCSSSPIKCIATGFEGQRQLIVVAAEDGTVSVRAAKNGLLLRDLNVVYPKAAAASGLQIDGSTQIVYVGTSDGKVYAFDLGELVHQYQGLTNEEITTVVVDNSMGKQHLFFAGTQGVVHCFDIQTDQLVMIFDFSSTGNIGCSLALAFRRFPSGDKLVVGHQNGNVEVVPFNPDEVFHCKFGDCSIPFGLPEHLYQHILKEHVKVKRGMVRCMWKNCSEWVSTRQGINEKVSRHFQDHATSASTSQ